MKLHTLLFAILLAADLSGSQAQQGTWTQKADFGGTARDGAAGFSIGSKGYIGTGYDIKGHNSNNKDFWEYSSSTNTWTQKTDFGKRSRNGAVGFSIDSKGYIGTGISVWPKNDFWEYDTSANTWTQKAIFKGKARSGAVGFSIGNKGYIGTGFYGGGVKNDFWEYDPSINSWTQKADFGGTARSGAIGFSIGSKGYIGTGGNVRYKKDFWEYDPPTNVWAQKADFGGTARSGAAGFSIDNKGYICTGRDINGNTKDFWEFDPSTNSWTQKADFGGTARSGAVGFSIGSKGYIGTGRDVNGDKNDFWEYTPNVCNGLTVYADADGDGYGNANDSLFVIDCKAPSGYAYNSTDCDDNNAHVHPGAKEICDGIDNNCNGNIDEGLTFTMYYQDADSDGFGNKLVADSSCNGAPAGFVTDSTDCDDTNPNVYPGAKEIVGNGIDDNCNGYIDEFGTGISSTDDDALSFSIYPNPANDIAIIQFTLAQSSYVSIKVFDLSGKEIDAVLNYDLKQGVHSLQFNTAHFAKGVYLVTMITGAGIENEKLIVQ